MVVVAFLFRREHSVFCISPVLWQTENSWSITDISMTVRASSAHGMGYKKILEEITFPAVLSEWKRWKLERFTFSVLQKDLLWWWKFSIFYQFIPWNVDWWLCLVVFSCVWLCLVVCVPCEGIAFRDAWQKFAVCWLKTALIPDSRNEIWNIYDVSFCRRTEHKRRNVLSFYPCVVVVWLDSKFLWCLGYVWLGWPELNWTTLGF